MRLSLFEAEGQTVGDWTWLVFILSRAALTLQSPDSTLRSNFMPAESMSASCCSAHGLQWPTLRCHR